MPKATSDKPADKTATTDKTATKKRSSATAAKPTVGKKVRKAAAPAEPATEIKLRFDRLPRAPFLRLVKEMAKQIDPDARVQASLLDRLEQVQQEYLYSLVSNTVRAAKNFNRKTMMVKDLDFVMDIQGSSASKVSSVSVPSVPATAAAAPATAASSN